MRKNKYKNVLVHLEGQNSVHRAFPSEGFSLTQFTRGGVWEGNEKKRCDSVERGMRILLKKGTNNKARCCSLPHWKHPNDCSKHRTGKKRWTQKMPVWPTPVIIEPLECPSDAKCWKPLRNLSTYFALAVRKDSFTPVRPRHVLLPALFSHLCCYSLELLVCNWHIGLRVWYLHSLMTNGKTTCKCYFLLFAGPEETECYHLG